MGRELTQFSQSSRSLVGNIDQRPARFAMNRVTVMFLQPTGGTAEPDLGGVEQYSSQIQKKGHSKNHDGHSNQTARCSGKRDVAKAGRRECGHGEIKRICIILDVGISRALRLIDNARHYKDEHRKISRCGHHFFMAPEEWTIMSKMFNYTECSEQA